MVILDLISVLLLLAYALAEDRYLPTVRFELLFAVMAMAMAVLSYLYNSLTSLAISSVVFLLVMIRILRIGAVIKKWRKKLTGY
ncbi:MAG: hypothetical protein JHC26_00465 [Thermofilum sp.]|jgi:hypothetical protein|uniref:hypothetical protein n=1 Tax=Thermofilum sp. TaxID=1961369 RepID=UPI00258B2144|nr:hypothetical protein [Thermofilum sp.]MCI4407538.1 hypothetical protein [Thermofilum sp.]